MLTGSSLAPLSGIIRKIVIFLHGYGSDGANLIDISHEWSKHLPDTLFVSPNAPYRCDVSPLGYQWFGLSDFNPLNIRQGLDDVAPTVTKYIHHLMSTYKLEEKDIALVGFSQGCILSLEMIFHIPSLAGVVGYSGAFYPPLSIERPKNAAPVLLVHGTVDTVVPYGAMLQAQTQLSMYGVDVDAETCVGLGHSIDDVGLKRGLEHLKKAFS